MTTGAKIKAQELDYFGKYYGDLVGAKIVSFDGMQDDDLGGDGFPTFTVLFKSGESGKIQISRDPEGNGGGFIFGLSAD
jgi:hypothetical protein